MKILLVSALYPPYLVGGAEKAVGLLAEALADRGHEVVVVSLHPESSEAVEVRNGVRVYRIPLDNLYWPFGRKRKANALARLFWHVREMWNRRAARRVGRILDIERPDVVHTHNLSGFSLSVWREVKRRRIRLVHTLHDYYMLCSRSSRFRNGRNCERTCTDCRLLTINRRRLSGVVDAVVSVSQYTLDEHLRHRHFDGVPRAVIPNIYGDGAAPAGSSVRRDGVPGSVVFGFIGRIEEPKGIETLLAALDRLQPANWTLRIAGTGLDAYVRRLRAKFPDPRIEWLGFANASQFYASVDVVIIPSVWADPLPYVCVESLHAGKRMICALAGGIPEIARLSSRVEFFPAGDSAALAQKMSAALVGDHPVSEPERAGGSRLSMFTEDHVTREHLRQYMPGEPG